METNKFSPEQIAEFTKSQQKAKEGAKSRAREINKREGRGFIAGLRNPEKKSLSAMDILQMDASSEDIERKRPGLEKIKSMAEKLAAEPESIQSKTDILKLREADKLNSLDGLIGTPYEGFALNDARDLIVKVALIKNGREMSRLAQEERTKMEEMSWLFRGSYEEQNAQLNKFKKNLSSQSEFDLRLNLEHEVPELLQELENVLNDDPAAQKFSRKYRGWSKDQLQKFHDQLEEVEDSMRIVWEDMQNVTSENENELPSGVSEAEFQQKVAQYRELSKTDMGTFNGAVSGIYSLARGDDVENIRSYFKDWTDGDLQRLSKVLDEIEEESFSRPN